MEALMLKRRRISYSQNRVIGKCKPTHLIGDDACKFRGYDSKSKRERIYPPAPPKVIPMDVESSSLLAMEKGTV
jgi:hypothetical protein